MRRRWNMTKLVAAITAIALSLLLVSTASAKGPFDIEVWGRDLEEPVSIAGPFEYDQLYPPIGVTPVDVATLEGEEPYLVAIVVENPDTGEMITAFTLDYYPASDDHAAALHDANGNFIPSRSAWRVTDEMQMAFDEAGIGAEVSASSDDTSAAWYLIPAGLVGLVAVGGLGGIFLKRKGAL
jgi:hypothetical protein